MTTLAEPTFDLRTARLKAGKSAPELATVIDVHPATVFRWERRERQPGPGEVTSLSAALGVDRAIVSEFFLRGLQPVHSDGYPGRALRILRDRAGTSAGIVARSIGVPPHTVYNWESGRARIPAARVGELAAFFGTGPSELTGFLRRNSSCTLRSPEAASTGNRLRSLRSRKGLSIGALAPRLGVSAWALRNWELDRRKPTWHGIRQLALHLDVPIATIAQIVGLTPPPELRPAEWTPGSLGTVLRLLRNWSGLTQQELAVSCGCSGETVRGWEAARFAPSDGHRRTLEDLYRLDARSLIRAYPSTSRSVSV